MRFFFLLITFACSFSGFSVLDESIDPTKEIAFNQLIAEQIDNQDEADSNEEIGLPSQAELIDSDQIENQDNAGDKKPKKIIKNLEYFLLAGFFILLIALYFFVRKKK